MTPTTRTPLVYAMSGRTMDLQPIDDDINDVAWAVLEGTPIVVRLEPGDATHYALLIIPADAPFVAARLGQLGIPVTAADHYWFVTYLDDTGGTTALVYTPCVGEYIDHIGKLSANKWSQTVIAAFLARLWDAVEAICE